MMNDHIKRRKLMQVVVGATTTVTVGCGALKSRKVSRDMPSPYEKLIAHIANNPKPHRAITKLEFVMERTWSHQRHLMIESPNGMEYGKHLRAQQKRITVDLQADCYARLKCDHIESEGSYIFGFGYHAINDTVRQVRVTITAEEIKKVIVV